MTTLELLNKKINALKEALDDIKNSGMDEVTKLEAQIVIIEECEKMLEDEDLIINYDFKNAIELIRRYNFNIESLESIILDIQSALSVRKDLELSEEDMPLDENQISTFALFIESLKNIKVKINKQLQKVSDSANNERKIKNLEELKNILSDLSNKKYVTIDIFEDFYEEFDILNLPFKEAQELLEDFYKTRNLRNHKSHEKADFDDVLKLYREFLTSNSMRFFEGLLNEHKNEIVNNIDLINAREILQFFKDEGIIDKFRRTSLLKITLYGKYEYIKNVVYPKIMSNKKEDIDVYYQDDLASVWIKENGKSNYRIRPFRNSRKNDGADEVDSLYHSCHTVNYDEFWENIELLKKNSNLFDSENLDDLGANLKLKTLPTWVLKKNIELCKMFGMGIITKIPFTCIERGDIEDKIHLAIELGMLNSPMTKEFLEIDKMIVRNEEFQRNVAKKKIFNQSIRNYFQRYLSMISGKSINEYAYLFYKLKIMGYTDFYNNFFSDMQAGKANGEFITDREREIITDKAKMDKFVGENFTFEWYSMYIDKYNEYDNAITENDDLDKKEEFSISDYFDENILSDELIKELEEKYSVTDTLIQNGEIIEQKNKYIYLCGDRIISRYKVLHNASILKRIYGTLTKEMVLTSIVRNSFINLDDFSKILSVITKGDKVL